MGSQRGCHSNFKGTNADLRENTVQRRCLHAIRSEVGRTHEAIDKGTNYVSCRETFHFFWTDKCKLSHDCLTKIFYRLKTAINRLKDSVIEAFFVIEGRYLAKCETSQTK